MNRPFSIKVVCGWLAVLLLCGTSGWAQEVTPQEKQAVRRIKSVIDRAGKQFKAGKLDVCQQYIEQAMKQVAETTIGARIELLEIIEPEYSRLKKAHQLLNDAGRELPDLAPLPEPITGDMAVVGFKSDVAPILVAKCGNCHVNRNRGNFSAATFAALNGSTMIAFGIPQDSRLIEVIENGEMPKGGLEVEPNELELLKSWIQQGAKFDGDNPQQRITEFATNTRPARAKRLQPTRPTGKETVSFGLHVAPILLEHCGQCHINNNPRGNLNMTSFRSLLAGGDGGPPFVPGEAAESLLFQRIEAGDMPPTEKLDAELIEVIGKWINEGASFADNARLEIQIVAAKAKSDSQSHEQLVAERLKGTEETWNLVMNQVESTSLPSENFVVIGSTTESRLTDLSHLVESLVPKIADTLKLNATEPLVKGNISVFVFDKRYDFSEFGIMVEQRDFPKETTGHWGFDTINAYATILMTRNQTPDNIKVSLARQITAVHTANLAPDVPRWFADGVGYWTAKKMYAREDEAKSWDADAWAAAESMNKPDDFIKNQMPADQAALVSYLFVKSLKSDGARFRRLMKMMQEDNTFVKSFEFVYGSTPEQLFNTKMKNRGR
jgi:hypothetical protein